MAGNLLLASLLTLSLLASATSFAQEPTGDRTSEEQPAGREVGTITVSIGGIGHQISFHQGDDGEALYQGDIILGPVSSLQQSNNVSLQSLDDEILFGLAIRDRDTRWPNGHVRYRINPDLPSPARVLSAISAWEAATDITFEEITDTTGNYIEFVPGSGCSSAVGMVGGRQVVRLSQSCSVGNTIHEIGHALGLHHEQARGDRGEHVVVLTSNILPGYEGNFRPDPTNFQDVQGYCHGSIMHYGAFAFSKQPGVLKTIETLPQDIPIGQRSALAACDIETIAEIYSIDDQFIESSFEGELELFPDGCEVTGKCFLRNDLTFTDGRNIRWKAGKWVEGSPVTIETGTTDGASVPGWAQPIIGEPFDDEYLKAAVLHDHYCYKENHVRGWRDTHRMFFNALQALQVPPLKSKIMYAAVYLGGPKWTVLVPGENCGQNCINDAAAGNPGLTNIGGSVMAFREKQYETPEFQAKLATMREWLEADPNMSLSDIEALALELNPADSFNRAAAKHIVQSADDPLLKGR